MLCVFTLVHGLFAHESICAQIGGSAAKISQLEAAAAAAAEQRARELEEAKAVLKEARARGARNEREAMKESYRLRYTKLPAHRRVRNESAILNHA